MKGLIATGIAGLIAAIVVATTVVWLFAKSASSVPRNAQPIASASAPEHGKSVVRATPPVVQASAQSAVVRTRDPSPNANPSSAIAAPPLSEPALMAELRRAAATDPARAVELARDGNRRFPNGPDAPERTSILIHALTAVGRVSEARGEAEDMVNRYPDSTWVREIERFTGAHRHRNIRLNDAGVLEYY